MLYNLDFDISQLILISEVEEVATCENPDTTLKSKFWDDMSFLKI